VLPVLLVAAAASPIVIGAVSLIGDTWYPVGDWASMLYRTSQVGTRHMPLVGTYTVKGWAHPGPFLFWASVAGHLVVGSGTQIGLTYGGSLVSRYVRPDGPWIGGAEPARFFSVQGSGPVPAILVLALLAGCVVVARRRRLTDVAALASLTIVLVAGSIPAAANIVAPAYTYLTQWLKVVGGLVWFTVAWTVWRVAEPALHSAAWRRHVLGAVVTLAVVACAAWSWGPASQVVPPVPFEGRVVQVLRAEVRDRLPRDRTYRVEQAGDVVSQNGPGLFYYMLEDGYRVVTRDGGKGLKWGHEHRLDAGDHYDARLTVAVHDAGSWTDAFQQCLDDPAVELVASFDQLTQAERRALDELTEQRFFQPETVTTTDADRATELEAEDFRAGVFLGQGACATHAGSRGGVSS
jgi:hypothetical protein